MATVIFILVFVIVIQWFAISGLNNTIHHLKHELHEKHEHYNGELEKFESFREAYKQFVDHDFVKKKKKKH